MSAFEVRCSSGDTAHADDAVAALVAARQLCEDDAAARPFHDACRTVAFHDAAGALIREVGYDVIVATLRGHA